MAVVGILAAIATPAYTSLVAKYRIATANEDLVGDLALARAEAARQATPVSVCQSTDGATCAAGSWATGRIVFTDALSTGSVTSAATILKISPAISAGFTMNASFNASVIRYDSTGVPSVSGTITSCRTGYPGRQLVLGATGRVSTVKMTTVCT